jgi:hypothetical protein
MEDFRFCKSLSAASMERKLDELNLPNPRIREVLDEIKKM